MNRWGDGIQVKIRKLVLLFMRLAVVAMPFANPFVSDLLALALNPMTKLHIRNQTARQSRASRDPSWIRFAQPPVRAHYETGWLVDFINEFGNLGGFAVMLNLIKSRMPLPPSYDDAAAAAAEETSVDTGAAPMAETTADAGDAVGDAATEVGTVATATEPDMEAEAKAEKEKEEAGVEAGLPPAFGQRRGASADLETILGDMPPSAAEAEAALGRAEMALDDMLARWPVLAVVPESWELTSRTLSQLLKPFGPCAKYDPCPPPA